MAPSRDVFFVSDSTAITAETLGHSILSQFEGPFSEHRIPFMTSVAEAKALATEIEVSAQSGLAPVVFLTMMNDEIRHILGQTSAITLDVVEHSIQVLEEALGYKALRGQGLFHTIDDSDRYRDRIRAVEFALEHDDGESVKGLDHADVIVVAPSRCGKTPTAMYLAIHYGIRAANIPLLEEDLLAQQLPASVKPHQHKVFGLLSEPQRLHQVRQERRPDSPYSSLAQCVFEVKAAEKIFRSNSIGFVDTSERSIEEISAGIVSRMNL